jgi:hypothetical protein
MVSTDTIGMDSRSILTIFIRGKSLITSVILFLLLFSPLFSGIVQKEFIQSKKPTDILWEIYEEVAGLERFANDKFIKGEFHINLDGNENNKEEHIVVLNHFASGQKKMLLQVTYFESRRKNSPVKYAKFVREIECCILDERIKIERCDYSEGEINTILPGILEGIRDKKKILDLIE